MDALPGQRAPESPAPRERRVLLPALDAPPPEPLAGGVIVPLGGATMGTTWSLKVVLPPALDQARLIQGIQAQLDLVVRQMSTWLPESDLCRFNRAAPGTWQALPPQFFHVLDFALAVARDSAGAYDPTAGALVNLWGFGPQGKVQAPPSTSAREAARAGCGWERVELDRSGLKALQPGGVEVDLSSVAKGYGVDLVAAYLRGAGLRHWLIEVGGELRGEGVKPDGEPWWVGLEGPPQANSLAENLVALHGLSVATSGDYRQGFEYEGVHYSHTIDARTGMPVSNGLVSVTVIHPECMVADALATALTVLGVEEGMAYARRAQVAALFIQRETGSGYSEHLSPAFAALAQ